MYILTYIMQSLHIYTSRSFKAHTLQNHFTPHNLTPQIPRHIYNPYNHDPFYISSFQSTTDIQLRLPAKYETLSLYLNPKSQKKGKEREATCVLFQKTSFSNFIRTRLVRVKCETQEKQTKAEMLRWPRCLMTEPR